MEKFARVCDISGKGMNEGYCFNDGEKYFKEEKELITFLRSRLDEESNKLSDDFILKEAYDLEEYYWTQWEDELEYEWYDAEGTLRSKNETLHLIYTIHSGIPDGYTAIKNDKKAKSFYIQSAEEMGVKFTDKQKLLPNDELGEIVREQLERTEKEIRWDNVDLI